MHKANEELAVSRDCRSCAKTRDSVRKHQKHLKLFPATMPFDFVAMDFLRPLPTTEREHHFVLVVTDRFSRRVRSVLLRTATATAIANALMDHWV